MVALQLAELKVVVRAAAIETAGKEAAGVAEAADGQAGKVAAAAERVAMVGVGGPGAETRTVAAEGAA